MDAARLVEADVREELRRRISAGRSRGSEAEVRALVDRAVVDYDLRSLDGSLPDLRDRAAVTRAVVAAVSGYGPLQRYFDDPDVEEIWINEPGKVFVARGGVSELTTTILDAETVADLVERMLASTGRRVDLSSPFVDASLPDGSRLHVVIPDVTRRHWAVNVRRFVARARRLEDLVGLGSLSAPAAAFLAASVAAGLNVLVSGGTQAGKTTLLNCLLAAVPPQQRIITCEEVFEIQAPARDLVALQCRQPNLEGTGEIPLRRLVKEALRMRPDRLVVGEVRQAESLDLLIALNSGLPGMATIHANSAADAVAKLCTLPLLAGDNVTSAFVVPAVASSVDLVVHVDLDADGTRRVAEVLAVPGRVEGGVVETVSVYGREAGGTRLVRGSGWPPHRERYARAGTDLTRLLGTAA
ncbi:CpaF family protein [Kineococcus rubinsiae]|uniref:CpaF family protein n=1 Tax=Kineococcus rubinsiae TaxID=2609562 RepID=UPI00143074D9|nr:ATPase, T2SS/T4P/T4SS family [Kineococcus rubinsiae]NIZ90807.1 CpaF family protein [Kineococcus rubinsiae]